MKSKYIIFIVSLLFGSFITLHNINCMQLFSVLPIEPQEWKIPDDTLFTRISYRVIKTFPKFNIKMKKIDTRFDISNEDYYTYMFLPFLFTFIPGFVISLLFSIFLMLRYCCNKCGGRKIPRNGYSELSFNESRGSIMIFSFLLEAIVIYSIFLTVDYHKAIKYFFDSFQDYESFISRNFSKIIDALPSENDIPGLSYYNKEEFSLDLTYSRTKSLKAAEKLNNFYTQSENKRYAFSLIIHIIELFICGLGIAAGNLHRSLPILIMIILSIISFVVESFFLGLHFDCSIFLSEFCEDVAPYIQNDLAFSEYYFPGRFTDFIPCPQSSFYEILFNYFSVRILEAFSSPLFISAFSPTIVGSKIPTWDNISYPFYEGIVRGINDPDLTKLYEKAANSSEAATVIDKFLYCREPRERLFEVQVPLCHVGVGRISELTSSTFIILVLLLLMILFGIPALKKFEWTGNVHIGEIMTAGFRPVAQKRAKAIHNE